MIQSVYIPSLIVSQPLCITFEGASFLKKEISNQFVNRQSLIDTSKDRAFWGSPEF